MTDTEFLRECAALFRVNDPKRAERLDAIARRVELDGIREREHLRMHGYRGS